MSGQLSETPLEPGVTLEDWDNALRKSGWSYTFPSMFRGAYCTFNEGVVGLRMYSVQQPHCVILASSQASKQATFEQAERMRGHQTNFISHVLSSCYHSDRFESFKCDVI